jgi:preprotein translocase subunit SecD
MMIKPARCFNIYLCAALTLVLASGCEDFHKPKKEREVATVSLHLEQDPDGISDIEAASIYRSAPIVISVQTQPFLDSRSLDEASVLDEPGGLFSIRLKFNWEGIAILDTISSSNPGRRIAIFGDFKGKKRWLASPVVRKRISNGVLVFTPDATREEADSIVHGLNDVAKQMKEDNKHQSQF